MYNVHIYMAILPENIRLLQSYRSQLVLQYYIIVLTYKPVV